MRKSYLYIMMAMALVACGRPPVAKPPVYSYSCLGLADDLKTLRKGDELPRVVQVLGAPTRAVRYKGLFGGRQDVLQYDVGNTACMRTVLHTKDKSLHVVFDAQGKYLGSNFEGGKGLGRPFFASVEPLTIDPTVFRP